MISLTENFAELNVKDISNPNELKNYFNKLKKIFNIVYVVVKMYPVYKKHRIYILNKYKDQKKFRGQKSYAVDYMIKFPTKMVKQGDVLLYCDQRRNEDTKGEKPNYKDNSRQIEHLRNNTDPHCFLGKYKNGEYYFMYVPENQELVIEEIIENTKNDDFSKEIIISKTKSANYKCELTGLPVSEGHLAADHWISKKNGGESNIKNCVILNKILNEKKNKHDPIVWFCKFLLTNFLNICKRTGMDLETVKSKLISFIQEF